MSHAAQLQEMAEQGYVPCRRCHRPFETDGTRKVFCSHICQRAFEKERRDQERRDAGKKEYRKRVV